MSVDSTAVGQLWVGVGVYVRSQHSIGPAVGGGGWVCPFTAQQWASCGWGWVGMSVHSTAVSQLTVLSTTNCLGLSCWLQSIFRLWYQD